MARSARRCPGKEPSRSRVVAPALDLRSSACSSASLGSPLVSPPAGAEVCSARARWTSACRSRARQLVLPRQLEARCSSASRTAARRTGHRPSLAAASVLVLMAEVVPPAAGERSAGSRAGSPSYVAGLPFARGTRSIETWITRRILPRGQDQNGRPEGRRRSGSCHAVPARPAPQLEPELPAPPPAPRRRAPVCAPSSNRPAKTRAAVCVKKIGCRARDFLPRSVSRGSA